MKYKALFLDIDGTVVPYNYNALPSDNVASTLQNIQNKISLCFVTGRSLIFLKPILKKTHMHTGYAVVNNGANVISIATNHILYDQPINKKDIYPICSMLEKERITYCVKQGVYDTGYIERPNIKPKDIEKASMIFTEESFDSHRIDDVQKKLSHVHDITTWKTKHKDGYGLNIQHAKATKLHGVEIILKELGIERREAIGVGDGYNDYPLLSACGLKIAMGNAVPELKAIADFIAPPVEEDGVATVIEKFILHE